jgi:hypothetical protein
LTLEALTRELNAVLRRKEEARIYHWQRQTGEYPPRRNRPAPPAVLGTAGDPGRPP